MMTAVAVKANGSHSYEEADNQLGASLAGNLKNYVGRGWHTGFSLNVTTDTSYESVIRSLRSDKHVETVIGNLASRDKTGHVTILNQTGKASAVVQTLYGWRQEDVAAILDELECLQYCSGLALAVLAIALPYAGPNTDEQHNQIRQIIDNDFGPFSGRLSGYVNPDITFTGNHMIDGKVATHWSTGENLTGYTGCCIYYPFGDSGMMPPFDHS